MKNLLIICIILISASAHFANPGDLDTNFGVNGGYVVSDFLGLQTAETVNDVAVQSDGKIIIAGSVTPSVNLTDFLVARYNPDGTLDTTFSGDGIFTLHQGGADEVHAIVLQSDGKIVAVGEYGTSTANMVFRLNSNGTLDGTFGGGTGKIQVLTAGRALSVAMQASDDKIIVGGYTNLNEATICRLNTDGFLDTSFDTDGVGIYPQVIRANGVAIQSNGRIVFTGSIGGDTATARIFSNGALDNSFGSGGVAITAVYAGNNQGDAILVQTDGKILVSGGGDSGSGGALLIRYNSNGSLDTGFDGDGIRLHQINPNGNNFFNDIAQQSDGKILAVGTITYSILNTLIRDQFTLSRFNANGSFDNSFDGNGSATSQWCEGASGMFLQNDGKIAAVGLENIDTNRGTCTQRFNSDGSADSTFNPVTPNGRVTQIKGTVEAIAGLPNGKIMVAGWEAGGTGFDTAKLIRLNADGSLDTAFADDGIYEYPSSFNNPTYFYALKVLSGGSFYVAGEGGTLSGAIMIKFDASGNLDTTFSGDGIATASNNASRFFSIAIQSDGKVFGCGSSGSGSAARSGKFVRFATDGTVETSVFNNLNTAVGNDSEILACAFDSFGKLVVAGYSDGGANERLAISRHFTNLGIDTFFGSSGYIINDMSPTLNDRATDLAIQPDNKIVVSSTGLNGTGDRDFAVIRYDSNGILDNSFTENFGSGGISLIDFIIGNPNDEANALLIQPDGQILVGGFSSFTADVRFSLAKLHPGGTPVLGFGNLGRTTAAFPNNDARANALSFYQNDKILAAGKSWNGTDYDFAVARFENEFIPSAANVSVSGQVLSVNGNGIRNVIVTLTDQNGNTLTTRTSSFGYFQFDEIAVGQTCIISVAAKRFTFRNPTQIIPVNDKLTDVNFVANE